MEQKMGPAEGTGPFRCPKCGSVTWGQLQHCPECGESLTVECSECGGTWRYIYDYTYCPSCGAKVGKQRSKL